MISSVRGDCSVPHFAEGIVTFQRLCQTFTSGSGQQQDPDIHLYAPLDVRFTNTANYTMCLMPEFGSISVCATQSIRKQQPLATMSLIRLQFPDGVWNSLDSLLCDNARSTNYWRCALKWW